MTEYAIELECLNKQYRSAWRKTSTALLDLSLAVGCGEVFGFIGPNGAGKSTTIKIIMGLLQATSGTAKLHGISVENPQSREGVAYVPESPLLYDYLTPLEILMAGCQYHQINVGNVKHHCMSWLERFGIEHVSNKIVRSFSKGMTQRTALAHALAVQPKLLILDEPLSGLDPLGRKLVVDVLEDYRQQGNTIFFSSHVLYDVERLADRFGLIHQGVLRTIKSPSELLDGDVKVVVTSQGETPVPRMSSLSGQRWRAELPRSEVWAVVDALRAAGHQLLEIQSAATLEQAFLEWINPDREAK